MTPKKMKAVVIREPGQKLQISEVDVPTPGPREARIRVEACGVCHSDSIPVTRAIPGIRYPIIPGHEVIGVIDELGPDVVNWKVGQRVGVGWSAGYDETCPSCRRGDLSLCKNMRIPGVNLDGGYAQYMVAPMSGLVAVPPSLPSQEAAPLLCAGVTTYNSLRNSGARPGDVVAILGIGGLGHLGVQFANRMGFHTIAVSRGMESEKVAREMGAKSYIATDTMDAAAELQKLGGAKVVLATAPNAKLMSSMMSGLADNGKLMVLGVPNEPVQIDVFPLVMRRTTVQGWPSGVASDSEDTLRFSEMARVRPMIERFPLEQAEEAYQKMMSGKVRYRAVLTL